MEQKVFLFSKNFHHLWSTKNLHEFREANCENLSKHYEIQIRTDLPQLQSAFDPSQSNEFVGISNELQHGYQFVYAHLHAAHPIHHMNE